MELRTTFLPLMFLKEAFRGSFCDDLIGDIAVLKSAYASKQSTYKQYNLWTHWVILNENHNHMYSNLCLLFNLTLG